MVHHSCSIVRDTRLACHAGREGRREGDCSLRCDTQRGDTPCGTSTSMRMECMRTRALVVGWARHIVFNLHQVLRASIAGRGRAIRIIKCYRPNADHARTADYKKICTLSES